MPPSSHGLLPRARLIALATQEVSSILRRLNLGHDPFDPRQALALASHGLLNWLEEERETRLEEDDAPPGSGRPPEMKEWGSVQADWPAELQRPGWIMELNYHGHRLALFVVARRVDSDAPAPYALPRDWLASSRAEAVCLTQVQINEVDPKERASVLFEGWIDAPRLEGLRKEQGDSGSPFVRTETASSRPMHELFDLLQESVPATTRQAARPRRRRPNRSLLIAASVAGLSSAAAIILALILALRPPQVVEKVREVEVVKRIEVPPEFSNPLVETDLQTQTVRGTGRGAPIVHSRQKYTFRVRTATRFEFGWLFLVDRRDASLLTLLERQKDGTLEGVRQGQFDDTTGWEYFVTVLADRRVPKLGEKPGRVDWLMEEEIKLLQKHADDHDDEAALALLRKALQRAGLDPNRCEVRLLRVDHR